MSSSSLSKASPPPEGQDVTQTQFAALCWRMHGGAPEILLITSRDTGRWIVPKGWPMKGRSPSGAAAREAWEEAGVEGEVSDQAIGRYSYDKVLRRAQSLPCEVLVYPLRVRRLTDDYPERRQRRRKWFSPGKAARKVAEPELRALLAGFRGLEDQAGGDPDAAKSAQGKAAAAGKAGSAGKAEAAPDATPSAPKPSEAAPSEAPAVTPSGIAAEA
ncbi:NUDIX hydrolase [Pseudogemmobacter sonorensis]|uniref:NUDIX hydrolase n=1 Tax=Pseudogemmobacter sonorensis TaxID=2989681 RepID=UPI0036C2512D